MALENLPLKEYYDYSTKMIENGQIVVVNNPLMLYSPSSSNDDCPLMLNSCKENNFAQNLVLDAKYFQYENVQDGAEAVFDFSKNLELEVYSNDEHDEPDQPEFIDINKLSEYTEKASDIVDHDIFEVSEDDEVIFVKEYKSNGNKEDEKVVENIVETKKAAANIRRNPVRTVRNKSRDLSKELLFEEDFAFLDASDDEIEDKENKAVKKRSGVVKLPKEWPINVHERPEYNPITNQIECFDYTIRAIQQSAATFKKPKTDTVTRRKNFKKKPAGRKRGRCHSGQEEIKVPVEELKTLVNTTTDMLKDFFINSKKHKDLVSSKPDVCSFENKLEILKNQAFLFAIVNNLDQNEVVEKFKMLNVDSEPKC